MKNYLNSYQKLFYASLIGGILLLMGLFAPSGEGDVGVTAVKANTTRTVMVHLFEWKWTDIAQECENFLGPKGFAAVQVSPPQEHVQGSQWWTRYQPVSYQIESRGGTRAQFQDMVNRCNAVGVDIYVDAVINHMSGVGSGTGVNGSSYGVYDYPAVPYSYWDFHHCGRNGNDDIANYQDRWEVQNCELVNLADLDTGKNYVRDQIAAYMNDLIGMGVAGFRIDASKHMSTGDIAAIVSRLNGNPYIFQEVIDQGGEPITASEYFQNGDVTEFKYSVNISNQFFSGQIKNLSQFGTAWGFMPDDKAVVFVDNHDNQRGHGGGGHIVTFQDGTLYDLTNVFMLAWPYGYPKVMSSYAFSNGDQGPPSGSVYSGGTPQCFNQWQCEHRWQPIANMVGFRNATVGEPVQNWWDNGNNRIAFSRGNKGFVMINREGSGLSQSFQTGLPAGSYCDVISGEPTSTGCTGDTVTVNSGGWATISTTGMDAVALHVNALAGNGGGGSCTTATVNFSVSNATTYWGQNVYVVGNTGALGNWNTANAVLLSPTSYPTWTGSVSGLPANTTIEYKYIKKDGNGNVVWQSGANQTVTTPCNGSTSVNNSW